jgi:hypothetical protein
MGTAYVFYAEAGTTTPNGKTQRSETTRSEEVACVFLHGAPELGLSVAPVLCLRRADGVVEMGWRPSADDAQATDWKIRSLEAVRADAAARNGSIAPGPAEADAAEADVAEASSAGVSSPHGHDPSAAFNGAPEIGSSDAERADDG